MADFLYRLIVETWQVMLALSPSLLLGLVIFVLLCSIPLFGWAFGLIATFFGLGALWLVYNDRQPSAPDISGDQTLAS